MAIRRGRVRAASTVAAINELVFGRRRYRTFSEKLAALAYELVKQHFFVNGNKRIAFFFLVYALVLNGKTIAIETSEARADLMDYIAKSDPSDRQLIMKRVADVIREAMKPLDAPVAASPSN